MTCKDVERQLDPYVDGELEEEEAAAVRDHLATCAGCRDRVAGRETLSRIVRSAPYYSAPDALRERTLQRRPPKAWTKPIVMWAAAA